MEFYRIRDLKNLFTYSQEELRNFHAEKRKMMKTVLFSCLKQLDAYGFNIPITYKEFRHLVLYDSEGYLLIKRQLWQDLHKRILENREHRDPILRKFDPFNN